MTAVQLRAAAELERRRRKRDTLPVRAVPRSEWCKDGKDYVNSERGTIYTPHHDEEAAFIADDSSWRWGLLRGGEGSGKSTAGVIKVLERLRRGMSGIMVSPDLEHFKKSLWPEFRRWCPWDQVVPPQRRRASPEWVPSTAFALVFTNGAVLYCGGIETPESWEGPNVNFAHMDEARRKKDASALKVLDGRIRIPGPAGEPPQGWCTSSPRMHWLYDYFGPLKENDPLATFKAKAVDVQMRTADNSANLAEGYAEERRNSLETEAEAEALLDGEWREIADAEAFLSSMLHWDACKADVPVLGPREIVVLAADAGVSSDCFAVVAVTRHWDAARSKDIAVRWYRKWEPKPGKALNFDEIEAEIALFCQQHAVYELTYDIYQLHQMMTRLRDHHGINVRPFPQGADRLLADKQLLDLILSRALVHDGSTDLRKHIENADRKKGDNDSQLRIVKRTPSQKIDLAVALSMAAARCLKLNLG